MKGRDFRGSSFVRSRRWRHWRSSLLAALSLLLFPPHGLAQPAQSETFNSNGMCDASAAVALGNGLFVVANDEDNRLRVYLADHPGESIEVVDTLYEHLGIDPATRKSEADIEGAAWLGDRVFWITSHGRDGDGKQRPNRLQFCATTVQVSADGVQFQPVGRAYTTLLDDLIRDNDLEEIKLADAVQSGKKTAPELAPKESGLNIEGLAVAPGGDLFIGFRNPRPQGRALLVPFKNPRVVIESGARAKFGKPVLLDLGGLGIRSIEYDRGRNTYWLVAGSHTEDGPFVLYRWSGQPGTQPRRVMTIADLRPEALIVYPGRPAIQILSDDGGVLVPDAESCTKPKPDGSCECKDLKPDVQRFRSAWITPD